MSVLVLGPCGVGKTALLTLMQDTVKEPSKRSLPQTIQTVGTNLFTISVTKKRDVTVRELGGAMAPVWKNYTNNIDAMIYVVDVSNCQQIASASLQLLHILNDFPTRTRVLLLLNKTDLVTEDRIDEFKKLFMVDELHKAFSANLTMKECSAINTADLVNVRSWLELTLRSC